MAASRSSSTALDPIVKIDGETVRIEGLDKPITLRAGSMNWRSSGAMAEFETSNFRRPSRNDEELRVEYEPKPSPDKPPVPPAAESISRNNYRWYAYY